MGLFEQIAGALGGAQQARQQLDRMAQGQVDVHNTQSPDYQNIAQVLGAAPPNVVQDAMAQAARQVDPNEYSDHVTPGAGGTNPLGMLDRGALGSLAGALIGQLTSGGLGGLGELEGRGDGAGSNTGSAGGVGGVGGVGGGLGQILQRIPGVQATDPNQMSPDEVAALARWMQQNHPEAFGRAATQVGQQQPDLLQQLLGNKALMLAVAGIGAKILSDRAAARR